jgi:histidinol-phosphate/aromatic aminotransferase/cobyric acid decarboxylase-like protein/adenosyl cobinamide kinase/adenosyl cobinamide phosphate guanylyltransferase
MPLVLVIGGTRSGKSAVAERLAAEAGAAVAYVATGASGDPEMDERIAAHRARRPEGWRTVESDDPAGAVHAAGSDPVVVDSLGAWLTTLMDRHGLLTEAGVRPLGEAGREAHAAALDRVRALAATAAARPALTVVVAEEAGLGPVAVGAATRRYLDLAGDAVQALASAASRVLLVVAGRALDLPPGAAAAAEPEPDLRLHGDAMVPPGAEDFAVNVHPEPRPPWLERALHDALARADAYPDEREAAAAVAARHGRAPEEVVITNGAAEGFWLLAAALRPRRAVCVHPGFTEPEAALRAHGVPVERAFRRPADFRLDPSAVAPGADLVVTANPNNPCGTLEPAREVAGLARPGRTLVVDEAFMEFVPGEAESLAARADLPGLVVVRSLTKLWSLAGVRAGYLLAPARLAAALRRVRPPWNANALALAALRACAPRAGAARTVAERAARARERLRGDLERLPGVRTWPSAANFLLARVPDGESVHASLLARGIAVRPARTFPGLTPDHLRVTVRDEAANARLATALREALA